MYPFQRPSKQPSMSNLDSNHHNRPRPLNILPQSHSHLNYIPESPDISRNPFPSNQSLDFNYLSQISPLSNNLLQQNIYEINNVPSLNQQANPLQLLAASPIEIEGQLQRLINQAAPIQQSQPNLTPQQQLLLQAIIQQQQNSGQANQQLLSLFSQSQQQQVQQQQQGQLQQNSSQQQSHQQQLQNTQQSQQGQSPALQFSPQQFQQQQQQQMLQAHKNLLIQLGLINSPPLIQQLLQTISNPQELLRFQSNLVSIQQQACQQQAGLQQLSLPPQMILNNFLQIQPSLNQTNIPSSLINPQTNNNPNQNLQVELIRQQKQKEELTNMLEYLVEKMHQTDTDQIFENKSEFKYLQGNDGQTIFDNIVHKYQFSKKTKEEMIKYILRKCFKFLKSNIKQQEIVGQKDIEVAFTRKYFGNEIESQQQLQIQKQFLQSENNLGGSARFNKDSDDSDNQLDECKVKEEQIDNPIKEISSVNNLNSTKNLPNPSSNNLDSEDIIDKVMPFKPGSKIKTMNIQFLKMIFRSEVFIKDYQVYLDKFEELAQKENQKKIQKCVKTLQEYIEKGQIHKVKTYKRLPWLKIWLKDTYELAKTLSSYADEVENMKDSDILASQSDLKKKIKTQPSAQKLPCSKVSGDDSEQQPPYSPPDFNQIPFQNGQSSINSASKLSKIGSPKNSEGQSEYSAILKKQQQLEEAQQIQNSNNLQNQQGGWKTPDLVKRSPPRIDDIELPANDAIKSFEAPKPKKSSELTQNDLHIILEQTSEKGQDYQQTIKHEENEQLMTTNILKEVHNLNASAV